MNIKYLIILISVFLSFLTSCKEFLDAKPDKKLVLISSIKDAQALINRTDLTIAYPFSAEIAAGDLYVTSVDWASLPTQQERQSYIWGENVLDGNERNDWSLPYVAVYYCNVVLDALDAGDIQDERVELLDDIRGQALFFRSYAFFELLKMFSKSWDEETSSLDLGIPLRLTSDFNIKTQRATVEESFNQIIDDCLLATNLLIESRSPKTLPTKAAAFALLSRVYLYKGLYDEALVAANNALSFNNYLLDYSTIDSTLAYPFPVFNDEVVLHTGLWGSFSVPTIKIDSTLVDSYEEGDLRKNLFFINNGDKTYSFKGSYEGNSGGFNGLTVGELYLIKAECLARQGKTDQALEALNTLLKNRWEKDSFLPLSLEPSEDVLRVILDERRKELVLRGIRWSDLKRLNKDPRFQVTLKRVVNDVEYILPPNDNRYQFPIPVSVIEMTGIQQNPR